MNFGARCFAGQAEPRLNVIVSPRNAHVLPARTTLDQFSTILTGRIKRGGERDAEKTGQRSSGRPVSYAAERNLLALGVEHLPLPEIGKGLISGFIPGVSESREKGYDLCYVLRREEREGIFLLYRSDRYIVTRRDEVERLLSRRE